MLNVLALNCTLKPSGPSSTDRLLDLLLKDFMPLDAETEILRPASMEIAPGVTSDEGGGDEWPTVRAAIERCDILVVGTPIWLGQPSSIAKRVMERLDAFLGDADEKGRTPAYGKVAAVAVVGNEDGAHHVSAELFQALADVGFTIAAGGPTYWVGEAMGSTDFKDLDAVPEKVMTTNKMVARNASHLAGLLKSRSYPGYMGD